MSERSEGLIRVEAAGEDVAALLRRAAHRTQFVRRVTIEADPGFTGFSEDDEEVLRAVGDNDQWPAAVRPELIVSNEEARAVRARNILEVYLPDQVAGRRVLDLGCGMGHVPVAAADLGARVAVGYDPAGGWACPRRPNLVLTDDWGQAAGAGPFDSILLYDVLDHCDDPVGVLRQAAEVLAPSGEVFVRFHPWCGRHGGHLYRSVNKAYLHYFLSEDGGRLLSPDYPRQKVIHPLKTYRQWITEAGLVGVRTDQPEVDQPEPFFLAHRPIIQRHWVGSPDPRFSGGGVFPTQAMSVSFLDCVLGRSVTSS